MKCAAGTNSTMTTLRPASANAISRRPAGRGNSLCVALVRGPPTKDLPLSRRLGAPLAASAAQLRARVSRWTFDPVEPQNAPGRGCLPLRSELIRLLRCLSDEPRTRERCSQAPPLRRIEVGRAVHAPVALGSGCPASRQQGNNRSGFRNAPRSSCLSTGW